MHDSLHCFLSAGFIRGSIERSSVDIEVLENHKNRIPTKEADDSDKVTEAIARLEKSLQHRSTG
jgi:hypothetical protein